MPRTIFQVFPSGRLSWPGGELRCAIGKGGVCAAHEKKEGDLKSPAGEWALRQVLYRPDREPAPQTALPSSPIARTDGWCDDPDAGDLYNKPLTLPSAHRHEKLWREDHVYDVVVVLGYNDDPAVAGRGSAIFMHLAREDYEPTEGCVALKREDLLKVLAAAGPGSALRIER